MTSHTKSIYGLIGNPLGHSFSRSFFNDKFKNENINAEYLNFELPDIGDLMEVIAEYPDLRGLNVTIPYKQQVIPYMDSIDAAAESIGAINVIKIINDGSQDVTLKGFNTDCIGFAESLRPLLSEAMTSALVLGTGGASRAICYALKQLGINVNPVSRTAKEGRITYTDLTPEIMATHKLIVNTTPLGMYPDVHTCPDIPYQLLTPEHLCYDIVYNPEETEFMKRSAKYGARTKNGLEMLHRQALAAWDIWQSSEKY